MGHRTKGRLSEARTELDDTRVVTGFVLVLISGLGFAISYLTASSALKGGIDVNTSNTVRFSVAITIIFVYLKATGKPTRIPPFERITALALGIAVFVMGMGYLGASNYIPISLAVLIFYTGPIFVVFISRYTEKEPITIIRLAAVVIAFLGLSLALEVGSLGVLQLKGILFALVAAVSCAVFVTVSSLTIRTADPQTVNFYALSSASFLFLSFLFLLGGPEGSITPAAILKLCGSGFAIGGAHLSFFAGLKIIGPVRASMLLNVEPIFTISLAVILLGESLAFIQFVGAALVIAGIIMIHIKPNPGRQESIKDFHRP